MRPAARYDEPYAWWGPGPREGAPRSLAGLLGDGTIDRERAALIWASLARRRSLAVIAGPSGAGKTTLLTALLPLLPASTRRVYLRGGYETFAFLADAAEAERSALLINEISPHLPVYLWGPAVRRALAARSAGYMLLATAHAESIARFVSLLAGSPLRIPVAEIAAFDLVVLLEPSGQSASGRLVTRLWSLAAARDGIVVAEWGGEGQATHDISLESQASSHPFPAQEILWRSELLSRLRERRILCLPDVVGGA